MAIDFVINNMRASLQEALDDIASPRVSTNSKLKALQSVERHLAEACFNAANDYEAKDAFVALQHTFECNVASRLLPWISVTAARLDHLSSKSTPDNDPSHETPLLCSLLALALSLIQGTVLTHPPTKLYLGRRAALEVLLDLLLTSRHLPPLTEKSESSSSSSKTPKETTHLTSIVLDTLLCILVDSSSALRAFEAAQGVQAIVKILKRAGTPREVRMKCLEFIYFYLLDETPSNAALTFAPATPASAAAPTPTTPNNTNNVPTAPNSPVLAPASTSTSIPTIPTPTTTAPATPMRPPKPYFAANPLRPTSRYGSSTFSFSGSSSKGLSVSTSSSSSSVASVASLAIPSSSSSPSSRSSSGSSNQSFCSTSSNASSGTDLSSVPASPVKESFLAGQRLPPAPTSTQVPPRSPTKRASTPAKSGGGHNHVRPNADAPTGKGPFNSAARYPQMRSMMLLRREVEYEPESPKKVEAGKEDGAAVNATTPVGHSRPATPLNRHKKSLSSLSSSSSIGSVGSIGSISAGTRPGHTRSRSQITLGEAASISGAGRGGATSPRSPTPTPTPVPMPHDALDKIRALQHQGSGKEANVNVKAVKSREKDKMKGGLLWKTTEEKKELLGTMLGNVDALVEGVRKAGVWGLA